MKKDIYLFKWADVSYDEMIEKHIEILNYQRPKNIDKVITCGTPKEAVYEDAIKKGVNERILLPKYMFLCDTIISRCTGKGRDYYATFETSILLKVIGNDYKTMFAALCNLNLIHTNGQFFVGKQCKGYTLLNRNIEHYKTTHNIAIGYRDKLHKELEKYRKRVPKRLRSKYKKALSKVTLDMKVALDYVRLKYSGEYLLKITDQETKERRVANKEEIENMKINREVSIYCFKPVG